MGLKMKEVGHLSLTIFNRLYKNYKNEFDKELGLRRANMTYAEAYRQAQKDEEWL